MRACPIDGSLVQSTVLADLTIQIGKLEQLFTALTTVIDTIILERAKTFDASMKESQPQNSQKPKKLAIDELEKQSIHCYTPDQSLLLSAI